MTQTADRYGKVLYDLRVPAADERGFVCGASAGENSQ